MNEIEKAMRDLELWYHPTTLEPNRTNAIESLSVIFEALKEKAERDKAQVALELRIMRNYERTISKAYRQRADNATLVQDILLWGTRTAGRTSCCEKCVELGIDPYEHEVIVNL